MSTSTPTLVAARSRAHGPAAALWHAVEVHRPAAEVDAACELALCGALARLDPDRTWPPSATDVCPVCASFRVHRPARPAAAGVDQVVARDVVRPRA